MSHKTKTILILFNSAIVAIGILAFGYFYLIDGTLTPILDISDLHTEKEIYHRGETINIISSFCKSKGSTASRQWKLVDHIVTEFPVTEIDITKRGCFTDVVSPSVAVPQLVADGQYYLEDSIEYQVNPLKTVKYVLKTNTFIIK